MISDDMIRKRTNIRGDEFWKFCHAFRITRDGVSLQQRLNGTVRLLFNRHLDDGPIVIKPA